MASVSMVSTAATFCCFVGGSSASSDRFLFPCEVAATFHGAGARAVPFLVVNA